MPAIIAPKVKRSKGKGNRNLMTARIHHDTHPHHVCIYTSFWSAVCTNSQTHIDKHQWKQYPVLLAPRLMMAFFHKVRVSVSNSNVITALNGEYIKETEYLICCGLGDYATTLRRRSPNLVSLIHASCRTTWIWKTRDVETVQYLCCHDRDAKTPHYQTPANHALQVQNDSPMYRSTVYLIICLRLNWLRVLWSLSWPAKLSQVWRKLNSTPQKGRQISEHVKWKWFIAYSSSMLDYTWNIKTLKQ